MNIWKNRQCLNCSSCQNRRVDDGEVWRRRGGGRVVSIRRCFGAKGLFMAEVTPTRAARSAIFM